MYASKTELKKRQKQRAAEEKKREKAAAAPAPSQITKPTSAEEDESNLSPNVCHIIQVQYWRLIVCPSNISKSDQPRSRSYVRPRIPTLILTNSTSPPTFASSLRNMKQSKQESISRMWRSAWGEEYTLRELQELS